MVMPNRAKASPSSGQAAEPLLALTISIACGEGVFIGLMARIGVVRQRFRISIPLIDISPPALSAASNEGE